MDNQHKKITGYRDLTQAEIDLMNEIKAKGEELRALIKKVRETVLPDPKPIVGATATAIETETDVATPRIELGLQIPQIEEEADHPEFWLRWADSSFRAALMYTTRAVARPNSY